MRDPRIGGGNRVSASAWKNRGCVAINRSPFGPFFRIRISVFRSFRVANLREPAHKASPYLRKENFWHRDFSSSIAFLQATYVGEIIHHGTTEACSNISDLFSSLYIVIIRRARYEGQQNVRYKYRRSTRHRVIVLY